MKKVLFTLAAVLTLASCAKEDVVREYQAMPEAIAFDNAFIDNATRGRVDNTLTNTNLNNFRVFGYVTGDAGAYAPIFDNLQVTGSGTGQDAVWTYNDAYTQYWIAGAKYDFAAIAPFDNANYPTVTFAKDVNTFKTTLNCVNNGNVDLLYAQKDPYTAGTSNLKVAFTFKHILSKVNFTFTNAYNAANTVIAVRNIRITNAYRQAKATLTAGSTVWDTYSDDTLTLNFGDATDVDPNDEGKFAPKYMSTVNTQNTNHTEASYRQLFLIPTTNKAYTVAFDIELYYKNGENYTLIKKFEHSKNLTDFNPAAGCSYNITATIADANIDPTGAQSKIEFTVNDTTGVEGWGNATDVNIPNTNN
ncbi:MAG: fimbrillin family protein [Alistipes sp.]|nr:fimbrillin family protein [Alistipes sp.]